MRLRFFSTARGGGHAADVFPTRLTRQPRLNSILPSVIILISPQKRTDTISGAVTTQASLRLYLHGIKTDAISITSLSLQHVLRQLSSSHSPFPTPHRRSRRPFPEQHHHHIARSRSAAASSTEAMGVVSVADPWTEKTPLFQEMAAYIVTYSGSGAGQAADRSANRQIIVFSVRGNFILQTVCVNGADMLRSGLAAA